MKVNKSGEKESDAMQKKGLGKQREKKITRDQKELDKGSQQGREFRENRKKWWKFRE